jgi:hypothetical protein
MQIASLTDETLANFIKTKHPAQGGKRRNKERERERETTLSKFEPKKSKTQSGSQKGKGTNHVKNQTLPQLGRSD